MVSTCVLPRFRHPVPTAHPVDFNVYYAASALVREGRAAQLYTGADTGANPQKLVAAPGTPIDRVARSEGLTFVGLYVYPPILADLLLPLTAVPLATATQLWLAINGVFLLLSAGLVIRLLRIPLRSPWAGLVLVSALCFTPALQCLVDGQITIFLLLLWAGGVVLYQRGWEEASAAVFALATAIKLTPALVLLPILLWRRWRFAYAYALTLAGLGVVCLWANSSHALSTYFFRVMPAMSGAIPYVTNFSLPAAVADLIQLGRGPSVAQGALTWSGRVVSLVVLGAFAAAILRSPRRADRREQVAVLALVSLLAPILSPVSWFHAYAMSFVAFAVLWREALCARIGMLYLAGLTAVSLLLGSAVGENLLLLFAYGDRHLVAAASLQAAQLSVASALLCYRAARGPGTLLESEVVQTNTARSLAT